MKSFIEFINEKSLASIQETEAKRSYDSMIPGSRSTVPVRNDRGIGPTVADVNLTDETIEKVKNGKRTRKPN